MTLTEYTPEVWQRFMHNQHDVAEMIGVSPNDVAGEAAQKLYDHVVSERERSR